MFLQTLDIQYGVSTRDLLRIVSSSFLTVFLAAITQSEPAWTETEPSVSVSIFRPSTSTLLVYWVRNFHFYQLYFLLLLVVVSMPSNVFLGSIILLLSVLGFSAHFNDSVAINHPLVKTHNTPPINLLTCRTTLSQQYRPILLSPNLIVDTRLRLFRSSLNIASNKWCIAIFADPGRRHRT